MTLKKDYQTNKQTKECQNVFKVKEKKTQKERCNLPWAMKKESNANKGNRLLRLQMQVHSNGTCIGMKISFVAAEKCSKFSSY